MSNLYVGLVVDGPWQGKTISFKSDRKVAGVPFAGKVERFHYVYAYDTGTWCLGVASHKKWHKMKRANGNGTTLTS